MIEKNCELVVLGGGGSGLVAAVRAAQLSGKKVIVLEKAKATGGGMLFASTMRTFGSKWQKERGIEDVTDSFLRKVMYQTYWRLDPKLAGNAIRATGEFFDWFCELAGDGVGDRFEAGRYVFDDENGPLGPQMGGPGGVTGSGRLFMDTLRQKCADLGVEVLTQHRVKDAETENGKITAVIASSPEGDVRVTCKACVLATGSWINNREVMEWFCPQFLEAQKSMGNSPHTNPNYTGDGFKIAERVRAKQDRENFTLRVMGPMVFSKSGVMSNMGNSPFSLAINLDGKRFVCEPSQTRVGIFDSGLVLMEQPGGYAYIIFDTNNLEAVIKDSVENPKQPVPGMFGLPEFPAGIAEAEADIVPALNDEADRVFKTGSVEELAAKIGVDPTALGATIADYNRYCREKFDADCFKEPEYLIPFAKAPYYAVRAELGTDGAFGGVLVNGDMQAHRDDGSLIDGLYVTGDFASGRFINMAGVKVQLLNDMSWALASGFLAGTNAAKRI